MLRIGCALLLALSLLALSATPAMAQSAILSWDQVTQDVEGNPEQIRGYEVAWRTGPGDYTVGQSTPATTLQVDELTNGATYYFVVRAVDMAGNHSAWSAEAEYVVPDENCNNLVDDDRDGATDCQDDECPPADEVCDDFDNDCDGSVDEGVADCCTGGDERSCSTDEGECSEGRQVCGSDGVWGACDGVLPSDEICDQLDNDCDAETDEGDVCGNSDGGDNDNVEGGCGCAADGRAASPSAWLPWLLAIVVIAGWRRRKRA